MMPHRSSTRYSQVILGTAFSLLLLTLSAYAGGPTVGPQVRVDVGGGVQASNETSIATTSMNPDEVVAVWNDWRDSFGGNEIIRMGVAVSLDGGGTWTDFHVRPPVANQSSVEGDPMTAYDHRTGTLWVGAISFAGNGGLYVARKLPNSVNFEPSVQIGQQFFADKCWMAAGAAPGNPNATSAYIGLNEGVWRSTDMGDTWLGPVSVPSGAGFLPRVGPNGEVYVTYWDFSSQHRILRSFDGGQTFGAAITFATRMDVWGTQDGSRFPGRFRVPSFNAFAVDPNSGDLYAIYPDTTNQVGGNSNVDLYFTKSTNQGVNWSVPVVIDLDGANTGDQFFPWIEVDDNGTIHMVYYDSQNTVQDDNDEDGFFDAYYALSNDGGASWTDVSRLTPAAFNSIDDGLDRGISQFIGDYLGLAYGGDKVYPCYLSNQNGDSDIFVHSITGPDALSLGQPVPGLVNQNNTLSLSNAVPNERAHFVYGRNPGTKNVPQCPGLTIDIANPKLLGMIDADGSGVATLPFFVPNGAAGISFLLQAGQLSQCNKSSVVQFTF